MLRRISRVHVIVFEDSSELTPVKGTQFGSNPGGIHLDPAGVKHYVKYYANPDQARAEALSAKIFERMGVGTTKPEVRKIGGKHALVSKWIDGLDKFHPAELTKDHHEQISKAYHAAILTKNWDVVGLEHDNLMIHRKSGKIYHIDPGGSFEFRAQGGHKDYGPDIDEKYSLLKPHLTAGKVFNATFQRHPASREIGKDAVRNLDMDAIHDDFKNSGLKNWKQLHQNFVARRDALLKSE